MFTKQRNELGMSRFRDGRKSRGMLVEVRNDDVGRALRTFSKKIQDSGLLQEVRERMSYEKPAVERQRMKKQARKRWERAVEDMISKGNWHKEKNY